MIKQHAHAAACVSDRLFLRRSFMSDKLEQTSESKNTEFLRVSGKREAAVLTCRSLGRHAERAHG